MHGPGAADPLDLLLLQHTKKFRLQLEWNIANFIQEKSTAMCQLESSNVLGDCARISSLFMAK